MFVFCTSTWYQMFLNLYIYLTPVEPLFVEQSQPHTETIAFSRGEYYCPMCRQISNSVLPMVPQEEEKVARPVSKEPSVIVSRISHSMFQGPTQTVSAHWTFIGVCVWVCLWRERVCVCVFVCGVCVWCVFLFSVSSIIYFFQT